MRKYRANIAAYACLGTRIVVRFNFVWLNPKTGKIERQLA